MSNQDQQELENQLADLKDALEKEQKARKDAEDEAKKAKDALQDSEQLKSEMEETLHRVRKEVASFMKMEEKSDLWGSVKKVASPLLFYGTIAVLILAILYWVFSRGAVLNELRDVAYARGLITFIFSLGTIGIGIILTLAALQKGKEAGEAFTRGKEVFTILVGILGTIVGFYFGSQVEVRARPSEAAPTVVAIQASDNTPKENSDITLSTDIRGGTPPYDIAIGFEPEIIDPIVETRNSEGKFEKQFVLPNVEENKKVKIKLLVSDASGKEAKVEATTITIMNVD